MQTSVCSFRSVPFPTGVLVCVLVFFLSACQTSKEDLNTHIRNGDLESVSQFAADNLSSDDADERVVHAIRLLADEEADTALTRLTTNISWSTPSKHTEALITALHKRNVERESGFYLCDMAIGGDLPPGKVAKAYLARQGEQKLAECLATSVSVPDALDDPGQLVSAVDELAQYVDVGAELRGLQSIAEGLDEIQASLRNKEREVSRLEEERNDLQETLESVREDLDGIQMLTAFVVGLQKRTQDGELYEIAFIDGWGRPSSDHAYLFTTQTQFQTKGRFTLPVVRGSNVSTRLRDEYGGFRQSWPFFMESTEHSFLQTALQSGSDKERELNRDYRSASVQERRLADKQGRFERDLKRQLEAFRDAPDETADASTRGEGVPTVVRVDDRVLPVTGSVTIDDETMYVVTDEVKSIRHLTVADSDIYLDATFSLDTAIGPFHPAPQRDGVHFQTADRLWKTYHYWNPGKDIHVWRSESRVSGKTGESPNLETYPGIATQLKSRPAESFDPLEGRASYSEARRAIVTSGWIPVEAEDASYVLSAEERMVDKGWTELQFCAGTGANPCRFEFERPTGEKLVVVTQGESDNPGVRDIFTEN